MQDITALKELLHELKPQTDELNLLFQAYGGTKLTCCIEDNAVDCLDDSAYFCLTCEITEQFKNACRSDKIEFHYYPKKEKLLKIIEKTRNNLPNLPPATPKIQNIPFDITLLPYNTATATTSPAYLFHWLYPFQEHILENALLLDAEIVCYAGAFDWKEEEVCFAFYSGKIEYFAPETNVSVVFTIKNPDYPDNAIYCNFTQTSLENNESFEDFLQTIKPLIDLEPNIPQLLWIDAQKLLAPNTGCILSELAVRELLFAYLDEFEQNVSNDAPIKLDNFENWSTSLLLYNTLHPEISRNFDENGQPIQRNVLIKNGKIQKEFSANTKFYHPTIDISDEKIQVSKSLNEYIAQNDTVCVIHYLQVHSDWNDEPTGYFHCPKGAVLYENGKIKAWIKPFLFTLGSPAFSHAIPITQPHNVKGITVPAVKYEGKLQWIEENSFNY